MSKHTTGRLEVVGNMVRTHLTDGGYLVAEFHDANGNPHTDEAKANAVLFSAANELLEALEEGRRAIGDHYAPSDCYATGPMTGDPIRDLVECPACSFIAMYERVIARVKGE